MSRKATLLEVKDLRESEEKSAIAGKKGLSDYRKEQQRRFQEEKGTNETAYQKRSFKKVKQKKSFFEGFKKIFKFGSSSTESSSNQTNHNQNHSTAGVQSNPSSTIQLRKGSQIYGFNDLK